MKIIAKESNIRLDQYLKDEMDISRSKIQKLIKDNRISVNNKNVNSSYTIHENDLIVIEDDLSFEIHMKIVRKLFCRWKTSSRKKVV